MAKIGKTLLKLDNVTMQFGGVTALNGVSLEVKEGEILALIGPNGAGKTTVFNVITGVYKQTSGIVDFDGTSLGNQKRYQVTALGVARTFQNIRLWGDMTAFENVITATDVHKKSGLVGALFGTPRARREEIENRERAMEILRFIGIAEIIRLVLKNEEWLTNGVRGITTIPRPFLGDTALVSELSYLAMTLAILLVLYVLLEAALNSPWGRMMRAIRDSETTAAAAGKHVDARRLEAFVLGSMLMGLGGALFAHYLRYIGPEATEPITTTFLRGDIATSADDLRLTYIAQLFNLGQQFRTGEH